MHIRRIACQGFKTYREETVIDNLDREMMTCVVGLNGSGKSSIFHAINFILSPKTSSANFLHEGSMGKSLSGFVEIEFANGTVLKRVLSLIKDEFIVNSKSVSRTEYINYLQTSAHLLGAKAPFYIVEQGRVAANVADRFDLLKEAVGVDVFDEKKAEALEILAESAEKETKLEELVSQIDQKCESLERDCAEMSEYVSLRAEKDAVEVQLANAEMGELQALQRKTESNLALEKQAIFDLETQLGELWDAATALGIDTDRVDEELATFGLAKASEKIANFRTLFSKQKEMIENEELQVAKMVGVMEQVGASVVELETRKTEIEKSIGLDETELKNLEEKRQNLALEVQHLSFLKNSCSSVDAQLVHANRLRELELMLKTLHRRNAMIKVEIHEKDLELAKISREAIPALVAEIGRKKAELGQIESRNAERKQKMAALAESKTLLFRLKQKEFEIRRETESVARELASANSQVLKNTNGNTRGVVGDAKNISGVVGLFGDFVTVPSIYRKAVESVGRSILFNVLIESDAVADQVVKALKLQGKVTLVPLNRVKDVHASSELIQSIAAEGIEACLLSSVIKVNEPLAEHAPVIASLINKSFSRTVLVESLEIGMVIARKFGVDTVTLDGDQVSKNLIVRGGMYRGSIVRNWQFAIDLKAKLAVKRTELKRVQSEIQALEAQVADTNIVEYEDVSLLEAEIATLEKELKILETKKREKIDSGDLATNELELKNCEMEIADLTNAAAPAERVFSNSEESELKQKESDLSLVEMEISKTRKRIANLNNEINVFIKSRIDHLREIATENERGKAFSANKIAHWNEELLDLQLGLEASTAELAQMRTATETLEAARAELARKVEKNEEDITKIEFEKSAKNSKIKALETKIGNLEAEIASCCVSIQRLGGGTSMDEGLSIRELRVKVIQLNKELSLPRFDLVNKKSFDEHDRVKRDRRELLEKKSEVSLAKSSILELLDSLNQKETNLISESLVRIRSSFNSLFEEATQGGSIELELDEQTSSSLLIRAAFPNLGLKNLGELSGGQRTVVSLCFLLSLARGGFYVMDEVDAALDDKFREGIARAMDRIARDGNQFFFTSFRPEFCRAAGQHFMVSMNGGTSRIVRTTCEASLAFVAHEDTSNKAEGHLSVLDQSLIHGA